MGVTKVAGIHVQTKVLSVPSLDDLYAAQYACEQVIIQIACYCDGVETVSNILIDNVHLIIREGGGGYEFAGTYYDMAIHTINEQVNTHLMFDERGPCRVRVSSAGDVDITCIVSLRATVLGE